MIAQILMDFFAGFIVAIHLGILIGIVGEVSKRALFILFVALALLVSASWLIGPDGGGPSAAAASINWPMLIGTIPGYIIGPGIGVDLYRGLWKQ